MVFPHDLSSLATFRWPNFFQGSSGFQRSVFQVRESVGICIDFPNVASKVKTVTTAHSVSRGGDRLHLLMRGTPKNLRICFQTTTGFHRHLAKSLGQNNESFSKPQTGSLWVPFCSGRRILSYLSVPALEQDCLPGLASAVILTDPGTLSKSQGFGFLSYKLGLMRANIYCALSRCQRVS